MLRQLLVLAAFVVVTFAVAAFGSQFQPGDWYLALDKPSWTPPGWIFPPVWTLLYLAMAVAAWLVWRTGGWRANRLALTLYASQLAVNGIWSWLFFGRQAVGAALVDIAVLLVLVVATTMVFRRRSTAAGRLMVPYLLWLGFATALNFQIWRMN